MSYKNPSIRLAIADDHSLYRKGLTVLLASFQNMEIAIEASNGETLIESISTCRILPDICILDINMPQMNGYETIQIIQRKYPSIKVLVLTMFEDEFCILKMLQYGAAGYLTKDCNPADLKNAITSVYREGYYHNELIGHALKHRDANPALHTSTQELIFLKWSCTDLTYKAIAQKMNLSLNSINTLRETMFKKFGVVSRTALAMYALKIGIFSAK